MESCDTLLTIIVRLFHLKLKAILEEILRKKIFGYIIAYVHPIEFQKRGLPYANMFSYNKR